jgi:hypothetical protein
MPHVELSVVIPVVNHINLLKRTLWALASRPPRVEMEVVVVGDKQETLPILRQFTANYHWKLIDFQKPTSSDPDSPENMVDVDYTAPMVNLAFQNTEAELVAHLGSNVIPIDDTADQLVNSMDLSAHRFVFANAYDLFPPTIECLDEYGANIMREMVKESEQQPLLTESYRTDLAGYFSITNRKTWERLGGYDERLILNGEADTDFVGRAKTLPDYEEVITGTCLRQRLKPIRERVVSKCCGSILPMRITKYEGREVLRNGA